MENMFEGMLLQWLAIVVWCGAVEDVKVLLSQVYCCLWRVSLSMCMWSPFDNAVTSLSHFEH